jgi:hypothetical protein
MQVALLVRVVKTTLEQRISIEDYLAWSSVVSVLLLIPVLPSIMLGYLIVIPNCLILLALGWLTIHRNHLIAIVTIAGFSLIGAHFSGTGIDAITAQIVGITVTSVYYFSVLTNLDITPRRWMEMYIRGAFVIAILGLAQWAAARILHLGDGRLMSVYLEPSHYIFLTLPAIGYCINRYVSEQLYGWETVIFLLTYLLADSSLGFLGLLLIGLFAYAPRLKGWQILLAIGTVCALVGALYAGSENFRLRANDTVVAIAKQDLGGANASTFALLSNVYVTDLAFKAHPLTGVGIGGYANAYDTYISSLSGPGLIFLQMNLNRDDANSLFLRVAAELGIPGLFVLFGFIIVCARVRGLPYLAIRNAMLPYLLIRMGRFGAYFSPELYFFVGLYVLNYMQSRTARRKAEGAYRSAT